MPQEQFTKLLQAGSIDVLEQKNNCFRLPNGTKLQDLKGLNKEFVVQDKNSQQVLNYLDHLNLPAQINAWDCCCASGGKSILLHDKLKGKVELTLTDIRKSIIEKCKDRLQEAGIKPKEIAVLDLSSGNDLPAGKKYDIILCDAPCTGSGTWSTDS